MEANQNIIKKPERDYLFDNIKAFLIFSVIIAHFIRACDAFDPHSFGGAVYITSFSFIMQGFLFVSGYFSRNLEKCRKTAFKMFLFPYLLLMPIMYGFRYLIFGYATLNMIMPTMALWYLLVLFYYRLFLKDLVKIKFILPISVAVALLSGLVPFINLYFSLGRTLGFLPFFLLGYYCKAEHIKKIQKMPKAIAIGILIGLLSFSAFMAYYNLLPLSAWYFKSSYASIGLGNLEGLIGRALLSVISIGWIIVFISLVPGKKSWLTLIGQNTMAVYVLHIFIRYIIKGYGSCFGQDLLSYVMLFLIAAASAWVFSRPAVANGYQAVIDGFYFIFKKIFNIIKKII